MHTTALIGPARARVWAGALGALVTCALLWHTLAPAAASTPPMRSAQVRITLDPVLPDGPKGWRSGATIVRLLPTAPGTVYYRWDTPVGVWQVATGELIAPEGKHTLYARLVASDGASGPVQTAQVKTDFGIQPITPRSARPSATGGNVGVQVSVRLNPAVGARIVRIGGRTRYETAALISQANWDSADTVVIATGVTFADALTASGLAGCEKAPILLTQPTTLPSVVANEIRRLGASRAIIVGGQAAIGAQVKTQLQSMHLAVERIGGADRYETATLIGSRVVSYGHSGGRVFVARGDDFADALSVGPLAYVARTPLVLVRPNTVPSATRSFLGANHFSSGCLAGGTVAVSVSVETQLAALIGNLDRLAGDSRYSTSAEVAAWGVTNGLVDYSSIGIATGTDFADALCGGAAAGANGGIVLLTQPDGLTPSTGTAIGGAVQDIRDMQIFGGEVAIQPIVFETITHITQ